MRSLTTLRPGQAACLIEIGGQRLFRRRLMELGLLPGSVVKMVRQMELGGLLELEVRRSRVTVRRHEAGALMVGEPVP